MTGLSDINFETEATIRKALLSLSIFTLAISNVELASNTLEFFGLEIIVSLDKITAVFRLAIILLLFGLSLSLLENLPRVVARMLRQRDDKWWEKLIPEIEEFQNGTTGDSRADPYMEHALESFDWDDQQYANHSKRAENRKRILSYYRPIARFSRSITRYVLPVGLALTALIYPQGILLLQ